MVPLNLLSVAEGPMTLARGLLIHSLRGAGWVVENPVGSLVRRPYMKQLLGDRPHKRWEVHYCACSGGGLY